MTSAVPDESPTFASIDSKEGRPPRRPRSRDVLSLTRRRALQGLAAAGAVSLTVVDALPGMRSPAASAYTEHTTCRGYHSNVTTCVPSEAYFGSDNCNGSWHKHTNWQDTGDLHFRYTLHPSACDGRNAWRWYHVGSIYTKCSDGIKESWDETIPGAPVVTTFSICRTSHG